MEFSNYFVSTPMQSESFVEDDIQRCPFLRNINQPTNLSFSSSLDLPLSIRRANGPIFEDGPNFEMAFRLFHGQNGVVPLSGRSSIDNEKLGSLQPTPEFNPLAAKAATISLSAFGPGGPFGFDAFSNRWKKHNEKSSKKESSSQKSSHESLSNEWLETGQCPIAKSYRAVSRVLPLVVTALQPPPGVQLQCPPAVVAARAALARTALARNLRPQPLPSKTLAITMLGMAVNIPLGVWREHTKKFSPQWFLAVHAAVPFIGMLRKCVLMPKAAMAVTIAASILGQTIGSRAERLRLKAAEAKRVSSSGAVLLKTDAGCSNEGRQTWDPLALKLADSSSSSSVEPSTNLCY